MNLLYQMGKEDLSSFSKKWGWVLAFGVALVALGIFAISYSCVATIISVMFLGIVLVASGIVILIESFQFWWKKWGGFFTHFLMGILYLIAGAMLIKTPTVGSISLTLILAIFYIFLGISRITYALTYDLPSKGWRLFNGIITLLLGILILMKWPMSGLFIIGLFVGIDLFITGWVYIMVALSARRYQIQ